MWFRWVEEPFYNIGLNRSQLLYILHKSEQVEMYNELLEDTALLVRYLVSLIYVCERSKDFVSIRITKLK